MMVGARREVGFETLSGRIKSRRIESAKELRKLGYDSESVSSEEFYEYLKGETPSNSSVTIPNFDLSNDYFVIHELVEISELKRMWILVNKDTVVEFNAKVFEAHLVASEYELEYAVFEEDFCWVERRLRDVRCWLEDDHIPRYLITKFEVILTRFEGFL